MPAFLISFMSMAPDCQGMDAMHLTVDWPFLPREGDGLDIAKDMDSPTVE